MKYDWFEILEVSQNFDSKLSERLDRCKCECGWDGEASECPTEMEQESWEMPEYKIFACPICQDFEKELEFYPSDEWLERNDPEYFNGN